MNIKTQKNWNTCKIVWSIINTFKLYYSIFSTLDQLIHEKTLKMTMSDPAVTPQQEGPAADPALLANAGCVALATEAGIDIAIAVCCYWWWTFVGFVFQTMQQFGRELEQLPERGRRLAEQAMSSISTVNHRSKRSSVSQRSSKSNSGVEEDSFVRIVNTLVDLVGAVSWLSISKILLSSHQDKFLPSQLLKHLFSLP